MKILVIGGMHGNEPLGPLVVDRFQFNPVKNVDVLIANEKAYRAHARFIEQDMNRSFPGVKDSQQYEHRRPTEILKIAKKYDIVFDFHNTHCPHNDSTFVGVNATQLLYDVSDMFGLHNVIVADYDCINKYADNCISIEISLSSPLNSANTWYEKISELAAMTELAAAKNIQKYKFVYRMTLDDKERFDLDKRNLKAFKPLDEKIVRELGLQSPAYPIFINDAYTPYNYGGLLNRID